MNRADDTDPRGGRREDAGRAAGVKNNDPVLVKTRVARADKLRTDADRAALKLAIERGEFLPRDAYREASATLLAHLAQGLRCLPDTLERRGVPVEACEAVERAVDEALAAVADGLELFATPAP